MRRINPWAGASTLTAFAVVLVTLSTCMAFAQSLSPRSAAGTVFAHSVDMTGDGLRNAVVAYPSLGSGEVRIISRLDRSDHYDNGEPIVVFYGREHGDRFGESVAILNDVNGNGYFDLLIGAPKAGDQRRGEAYVFFGPLQPRGGDDRLILQANEADITLSSTRCADYDFGIEVAPFHNVIGDDRQGFRVRSWCVSCGGDGLEITQVFIGSASPGYPNGGEHASSMVSDPRQFDFWWRHPGDVLGDQAVTTADLYMLLQNYGLTGHDLTPFDGDLNGDGVVDVADLELVVNNLGSYVMRLDWNRRTPSGGPVLRGGNSPWLVVRFELCPDSQ